MTEWIEFLPYGVFIIFIALNILVLYKGIYEVTVEEEWSLAAAIPLGLILGGASTLLVLDPFGALTRFPYGDWVNYTVLGLGLAGVLIPFIGVTWLVLLWNEERWQYTLERIRENTPRPRVRQVGMSDIISEQVGRIAETQKSQPFGSERTSSDGEITFVSGAKKKDNS